MKSLHECVTEYRNQLGKGIIQEAYRGLIKYIMGLRTQFMKTHPEFIVSGNVYYGYMDMTYFAVTPKSLKKHGLKVAIVFLHEACRFEAWLSGVNRQVQKRYWDLFTKSNWEKYLITQQGKDVDSIVENVLVDDPDFNDLDGLSMQIEEATIEFIRDIERFLSMHYPLFSGEGCTRSQP